MRIPELLRPPLNIALANSGVRSMGLSEIFNKALDEADADTNLVFLHDDIYLNDWFFAQRVLDSLERFDVVGIVGSVNPDLSQPSWGLRFDADLNALGWQPGLQRSGAINHFDYASPKVSLFGPTPLACKLLDGAFIAVNTSAVKKPGVRFDTQFRFHCYDIDFCRAAAEKGLRIGTWPISVTHDSGGSYGTDAFKECGACLSEEMALTAPCSTASMRVALTQRRTAALMNHVQRELQRNEPRGTPYVRIGLEFWSEVSSRT